MTDSLASRLAALQERIRTAAVAVGREPSSIRLLAVSKTQPVATIQQAYDAGLRTFGENYVQEALAKQPSLPADIEWHCIGPLQSNKSKPVAEHFAWCQSIDSLKLAERLARQRPAGLAPLNVCVQLKIGDEDNKSGIAPADAAALADAIVALPGLRLRGVMTIPPPTEDREQQRRWFAEARRCFEQLQRQHTGLDTLSMGMSADLEAAIAEGSSLIRVGTALFGPRPRRS
ncbi:MAG: YggS family pyridoxal phosphate-dependent enzyme [Permianibacter sp.]